MPGFGFFDASEYEPKEDKTAWIIQDLIPKGFGFVAGPPKGNSSPHGGKSVFERQLALSIISGQDFMGFKVNETGKVMFMNLDETQDKQVRLYYRMTKGKKVPGYLISEAKSCRLPDQMTKLEEDIKAAGPLIFIIDPMLRVMGGKKVKEQSDVGPILDHLKRICHEYGITIIMNHHSNKSPDRDKESTMSWLSGSVDLDAAWDFCIAIEHDKSRNLMHVRNFQKEKAKTDFYYQAEIIHNDEIVGLHHVPNELLDSEQAIQVYNILLKYKGKGVQYMVEKGGLKRSSLYYQINRFDVLKKLHEEG